MALPIKSIFSCLVILATVSNISTQRIEESGSRKELVSTNSKTILLGSGVETSQLPIILHSLVSSDLYVSAYILSGKKCDFTISIGTAETLDVQTVQQLTDSRVVLIWSILTNKETTKISVLDMDSCDIKKTLESDLTAMNIILVPFSNGFDLITKNARASYDIGGNPIGATQSFKINSKSFSISAASGVTSTKGFYVVDYSNKVLNLVYQDGTVKKSLLELPADDNIQIFTNNEQSLYSVCWFDTDSDYVVDCLQYNDATNEQWKNTVTLTFEGELEVKNLAGGRLAFVALSGEGDQFSFVEMGPEKVNIWNHSLKDPFDEVRFTDFTEGDDTFVLVYQYLQDGEDVKEAVESQKYTLISKN